MPCKVCEGLGQGCILETLTLVLPGIGPGLVLPRASSCRPGSPTAQCHSHASGVLGIFWGESTGCLVPSSAAPWLLGH